ncbi:hypothetical protein SAMN05421788_107361 [Filimonas lacunae]|uniref:Uncharacterized protein n=1 Tax=Filimonas lacunae TaxID=477680 RepID=A0A173MGT1_9BACT|nr:hypothetical protein [Filimonas lacunae]BAV06706.1 hypothetical protein FLA_2726 [Filimonas lacunae]SIT27957.1 hypothetical protein SAMN05421788_107361 [Filimonas lacunae]
MEAVTDFFKELRSRFTNPLFSSFLFAWAIFNWRVVLGIIRYPSKELERAGYDTYIELVTKNSDCWNMLFGPIISAILYVMFFPIIRNGISAWQAFCVAWGTDWQVAISKDSVVPIDIYLKRTKETDILKGQLQEILAKENSTLDENLLLNTEIVKVRAELEEKAMRLKFIDELSQITFFEGDWLVVHRLNENKLESQMVSINSGNMNLSSSNAIGSIKSLYYNTVNRILLMDIEILEQGDESTYGSPIRRKEYFSFSPTNTVPFALKAINSNSSIVELRRLAN